MNTKLSKNVVLVFATPHLAEPSLKNSILSFIVVVDSEEVVFIDRPQTFDQTLTTTIEFIRRYLTPQTGIQVLKEFSSSFEKTQQTLKTDLEDAELPGYAKGMITQWLLAITYADELIKELVQPQQSEPGSEPLNEPETNDPNDDSVSENGADNSPGPIQVNPNEVSEPAGDQTNPESRNDPNGNSVSENGDDNSPDPIQISPNEVSERAGEQTKPESIIDPNGSAETISENGADNSPDPIQINPNEVSEPSGL